MGVKGKTHLNPHERHKHQHPNPVGSIRHSPHKKIRGRIDQEQLLLEIAWIPDLQLLDPGHFWGVLSGGRWYV